MKIKYIIISTIIIILFSGCAKMTPIQKASESTSQFGGGIYTGNNEKGIDIKENNAIQYRVFHRGSTGFTPLYAVRESAEKRADNFCNAKNKARVTVSEQHSNPPHILGNWPRIELIFVCIDKNNNNTTDKYDKLDKLKNLLDNNTITKEEFEKEKGKILNEH